MHTIEIDKAIRLASSIRDNRNIRPDHELAAMRDALLDLRLLPDGPRQPAHRAD